MTNLKYGVRIYKVGKKLLVKQTVLKGTPPEYVIENDNFGNPKEVHVDPSDDAAVGAAVRGALSGKLEGKGRI